LRDLARRPLALVMQPRILQLRRLVIGEAGCFPELGRTFYERPRTDDRRARCTWTTRSSPRSTSTG